MPLVEINITKGKNKDFLLSLMNETMNCIQSVLKLPADDTNVRLMEYEEDFFRMKTPYNILVCINMFSGRTSETKKNLYKTLVEQLYSQLAINPKEVFILINEQPRENWGVRGGVAASDIDLNFKVEV